jgi:thioredoxin reductase
MKNEKYDAIIVGGSFAGLATAYFTKAEKLLILERER